MSLEYVPLRFAGSTRQACVRELRGRDEVLVGDSFTPTAIRLLDRVLIDRAGCLPAGRSASLSGFDRDRVLAAVYRSAFADRIDSTILCANCTSRFDLHFSLKGLDAALEAQRIGAGFAHTTEGYFRTDDGAAFRLPNGDEECTAAALPPADAQAWLAAAVVPETSRPVAPAELNDLLDRAAPLLDLPLDASCPECGTTQQVRFSVQSYLLESLINERRQLVVDVHRIASAYGWTRRAILALPRNERRQHADLIEHDTPRRRRLVG